MKRVLSLAIIISIVTCWVAVPALAESGANWPTWRGPNGTGSTPTGDPPIEWSEDKNIKWKVKFPGQGTSTPIIWGNKIFFQTAVETDQKAEQPAGASMQQSTPPGGNRPPRGDGPSGGDRPQGQGGQRRGPGGRGGPGGRRFGGGRPGGGMSSGTPTNIHNFDLVCMDKATGKILWQKTVKEALPHEGHHPSHGFSSYSPVTDGKYVWVNFGSRGVHCYDVDGNHKWSVELAKLATRNSFGEGSSPALAGDKLIVIMDQQVESKIYALDKLTGKTIWSKDRDELTSWVTPLIVDVDGKTQVIVPGTNLTRTYDAANGDLIWQCSGQTSNVIPTPVTGFGMVFCTSGYRGSALQAIKLGPTGDLSGTDAIVWQVNESTPYVPSPVLYDGRIYVGSSNRAVISCYDAKTGKSHFVGQSLEGLNNMYASPVAVANRVYFTSREGVTQVLKASDKLEVLATNTLSEGIDASPVVVGNELFLKGAEHLYCIAE